MESDWSKENKSHFADVIFGGDKRQPEIRLRSQASRSRNFALLVCPKYASSHTRIVKSMALGSRCCGLALSHGLVTASHRVNLIASFPLDRIVQEKLLCICFERKTSAPGDKILL